MRVSKNPSADLVRVLRDAEVVICDEQVTTNNFADVSGSLIDALGCDSVAYVIKNTDGANDLDYQVVASIDGNTFVVADVGDTVGEGATDSVTFTPVLYRYYKVQVKSTSGGNHADAVVHGIAQ